MGGRGDAWELLDPGPYIAGPYRYERMEDAGHWIPLDRPDRLNQLLLEFLTLPE